MFEPLRALLRHRSPLEVWHHDDYRLPLASTEVTTGPDARRADDALFYLVRCGAVRQAQVHCPPMVTFEELLRVHTKPYVESLLQPHTLASIFAIEVAELQADALLASVRLGCGGTVQAARRSLASSVPALNLLGGFHHAGPGRGGGFCAVNDVAVAIAAVRADGFAGKIGVLDLDAHPPDGTAECLADDSSVWLGSISGVSWGPLPNVDETVLPKDAGDVPYLEALTLLLGRMPKLDLAFVIAGGDVLAGDRLGQLGLTMGGVRKRELQVIEHLGKIPQVWLPAGGYGPNAWKVLAGTGLSLAFHSEGPIPQDYDPVAARFRHVAQRLKADALGSELVITEEDLGDVFGHPSVGPKKVLGYYTAEGLEYALESYGLLKLVRRLGYGQLHVELESAGPADRCKLIGVDTRDQSRVVLVELEVERKSIVGGSFLFVNWLSLRNPRAKVNPLRPLLPGQQVPGLGLARETSQMLELMARRLVLDGVAFRPSWYHMAYAARHTARFVTPGRQGRFEALMRDLKDLPLAEVTRCVFEGQVRLNGQPYVWEPEEMIQWINPGHDEANAAAIATERERCHFTVERPLAESTP